ncbi:2,3-dehydroadipyl-CoA hydratase [Dasania sp. GY-MA-18]|uniref:2,3-dehydroadipyl-CoA hydratase n=1 Tax=Dasania phycosphaerae TaxID=2950436 RepID=A0A9J6RSH8_9GAMM|nr:MULTISPECIES: 2,3-dehydroadipyl-CoA hydratase PaaF [Dasania]MCR8924453.1 2,3-dehydroadipyl-CoA hydratase [Dasania sp. GY-MA-18]MCZ0867128.1 2,3-dehydroadipyl-CoA hydratase [Dasania phycosphaerae]MCZ0870580.1 2,3-dehydroadipyl-CoA hydratase [Dasania phycosphaerae]
MTQSYENIVLDKPVAAVQLIRLNRPQAHNALTSALLLELAAALEEIARDDAIAAVVLTGGDKVFAAGADLKEMAALDMVGVLNDERPAIWRRIYQFPKPLIAAVNGFALGGGCELAMHADIIIAGDNAQFGQPEINLGMIPGAGGTQRLIRAVGKSLAMKMVLAGEFINAQEALRAGLVAEVSVPEMTIERAMKLAQSIAQKPALAVKQAKEVLLKAFETDLEAGLQYERKAFTVLAGTEDRNEGINAFLEKRKPKYTGR